MATHSAGFWIDHLQLTSHIEGGAFKEIYRSDTVFSREQLPGHFTESRNACTHIYFLLQKNQFSAFHRIRSDELWHFYDGDPLIVYEIDKQENLQEHLLGKNVLTGQHLFCVIRAGNWFAARLADGGDYTLTGCTVSPGFDFADFELAKKDELITEYPQHDVLISQLCS
jgi:predicted cupin superfamily sugar epimerase